MIGLACDGAHGERCAAACVAVQLGENHARDAELVIERLGHIHGFLAGHGIHGEQNLMRGDFFLDLAELIHERLVDLQAAGRINDDKVVAVILGVAHRLAADLHRFFLGAALKHRHTHARTQHLQLLDGGRAVHVGGHEQRPVALALEHEGQLGTVRRLAGALQAAQHDDGRRRGGRSEAGFPAAHEGGELLIDNLHHHLRPA